ncbi:MAG: hypothetical protein KG028_11515 [Actinobacteria bacterium]|jgi:hypothetical protein|nr:hypothetical protein [Actinomycetota bacterium]
MSDLTAQTPVATDPEPTVELDPGRGVSPRTAPGKEADMGDTTAATDAPAPASPVEEIEVECPGCGLAIVGLAPRPTAAWFCPRCDYPLFWVNRAPPPEPDAQQKRARRRLPGTAGATVVGAENCWHCGEMNDPGGHTCLRCAATLPKPIPPVAEIPVVRVVRRERTVVRTVAWPYVTAAALAGASAALAAANWIYGV